MVRLVTLETDTRSWAKTRLAFNLVLQLVLFMAISLSATPGAQAGSKKRYQIQSVQAEFSEKDKWQYTEKLLGKTNVVTRIEDPRQFGLTEKRVIRDIERALSSVLIDATKDRQIPVKAKVVVTHFWFGEELIRTCGLLKPCYDSLGWTALWGEIYLLHADTDEVVKKVKINVDDGHRSATIVRAYNQLLANFAAKAQRKLVR